MVILTILEKNIGENAWDYGVAMYTYILGFSWLSLLDCLIHLIPSSFLFSNKLR